MTQSQHPAFARLPMADHSPLKKSYGWLDSPIIFPAFSKYIHVYSHVFWLNPWIPKSESHESFHQISRKIKQNPIKTMNNIIVDFTASKSHKVSPVFLIFPWSSSGPSAPLLETAARPWFYSYGGFHDGGYPDSWIVGNGNSYWHGWLRVSLLFRKPPSGKIMGRTMEQSCVPMSKYPTIGSRNWH